MVILPNILWLWQREQGERRECLCFHVCRLCSQQTSNSANDQHEESGDERTWNREYEQDHTERKDEG